MKISYKHILDKIQQKPPIGELSAKLFQLGHEHEIENNIFDFEFTPNRGDCLSVYGLLRDLAVFYDVDLELQKYTKNLKLLDINFRNKSPSACPKISFLKIEIDNEIKDYNGVLKNYFADLKINKNNFFTDVSNYISYETGQPTHCYDSLDTLNEITLDKINTNTTFTTLFDDEIELSGTNLAFMQNNKIINLAGVMGGKINSCTKKTRSVIIECAYFAPHEIIGKSIKYGIQSEAAHKFERNVDIDCHENVLRRFIKIVEDHSKIKNLELYFESFISNENTLIDKNYAQINKILGTSIASHVIDENLTKLGFIISNNFIQVPSYRSDIATNNDIAEELARIIGYDSIQAEKFIMPIAPIQNQNNVLNKLREIFIDNGFYQVINYPFTGANSAEKVNAPIKLDNPLDSNRAYMRQNLLDSLINNLLYNERRQKDSLKFFEISDVYLKDPDTNKFKIEKRYGFIASGRVSRDLSGFSLKIDDVYLKQNLKMLIIKEENLIEIPRDTLKTKNKNKIFYYEGNIEDLKEDIHGYSPISSIPKDFAQYQEISEYPSSFRDLSLSIKNYTFIENVYRVVEEVEIENLKEIFMFDFFNNPKNKDVKIGYRFIFQSNIKTLEDSEIDIAMDKIIKKFLSIDSVSIPGIKN
jgi:phenylalanyl-tRNA synthetase beta chain